MPEAYPGIYVREGAVMHARKARSVREIFDHTPKKVEVHRYKLWNWLRALDWHFQPTFMVRAVYSKFQKRRYTS